MCVLQVMCIDVLNMMGPQLLCAWARFSNWWPNHRQWVTHIIDDIVWTYLVYIIYARIHFKFIGNANYLAHVCMCVHNFLSGHNDIIIIMNSNNENIHKCFVNSLLSNYYNIMVVHLFLWNQRSPCTILLYVQYKDKTRHTLSNHLMHTATHLPQLLVWFNSFGLSQSKVAWSSCTKRDGETI